MLTGKLVRVRYSRDRVIPCYLKESDSAWLEAAERLLGLFRGQEGGTRGELEEDVKEAIGNDPAQLVHQGLAKLLEDRCDFEVVSGQPPEELRHAVFQAAAVRRSAFGGAVDSRQSTVDGQPGVSDPSSPWRVVFDREAVIQETAARLGLTPEAVDRELFADLKSEQRLIRFNDFTAERLLQRYNVALAQAVLLRSTGVKVEVRGEPQQRYRQLFRLVKFHRLVCEVEQAGKDSLALRLDGPLSLFAATQKYGLQLAMFLPGLLRCRDFELRAELRWGPQRKPKTFTLASADGLTSHATDSGMYVPPELAMFAELFRKKIADWEIQEEKEVFPLGSGPGAGFWVPDFRLVHRGSGRSVLLEVLGFWRRASALRHLQRLRQYATEPFLLAVSQQLHIEEADLEGLPAGIHRFRQMPLPDEVARLAEEILKNAECRMPNAE